MDKKFLAIAVAAGIALAPQSGFAWDGYKGLFAPSEEASSAPRSKGGYKGFLVWNNDDTRDQGYSSYGLSEPPVLGGSVEDRRAAITQDLNREKARHEAERKATEERMAREFQDTMKQRDAAIARIQAEAVRAEQAMVKERDRLQAEALKKAQAQKP